MRKLICSSLVLPLFVIGGALGVQAQSGLEPLCEQHPSLCTETVSHVDYQGKYVGHDEPSLLFYSDRPGSGGSNIYSITLPKDPPTLPVQGTRDGGTFNFQLHPAFWFGMAMCDSESSPNFTKVCDPATDANIFDDASPASPKYIGKHPGAAFMELQFYPPGWIKWPIGDSCDATQWCAAVNIFSLSENPNTGQVNNRDCLINAGLEPGNFAFITKNGVPLGPPDPFNSDLSTFTPNAARMLMMNSGDTLLVTLRDTPAGLSIVIVDLTTGQSGSMIAGKRNGFGQIVFDPDPDPAHPTKTCQVRPYDFRPLYSTSSEHTRVPWAAHSYNIAFSDEIGHFEHCDDVAVLGSFLGVPFGFCAAPNSNDAVFPRDLRDRDDFPCFLGASSSRVAIDGCRGTDIDFDGVAYQTTWPGSLTDPGQDRLLNPEAVRFTSPVFIELEEDNGRIIEPLRNYDRVAFEADLPAIEFATTPACNTRTGTNCTNPPKGAEFYPFYTTAEQTVGGQCYWQLGGAHIPGTTNLFGGSSTTAYGPLLSLTYPGTLGSFSRFENFRNVLAENPCPVDVGVAGQLFTATRE